MPIQSTDGIRAALREPLEWRKSLESTLHSLLESTESRFTAVVGERAGIHSKRDARIGKGGTERGVVERLDNDLHRQIDPMEVLEPRLLSRIFASAQKGGCDHRG